jgi:hypothetical protein
MINKRGSDGWELAEGAAAAATTTTNMTATDTHVLVRAVWQVKTTGKGGDMFTSWQSDFEGGWVGDIA